MLNFRDTILSRIHQLIDLSVLGFDISDRSIKFVYLAEKKSRAPGIYGEIPLREGIIESGEIKDADGFSEICASWYRRENKKLPSRYIAASLPEEKSFLRLIQLPKVERKNVGEAVRWEIEANIPLSREEVSYGYEIVEPLQNHINHFDVVVTAYPKAIVDSYTRALLRAGFEPVALELESQAIVRAAVSKLREPEAKIIVDIGYTRTSLVVFAGGALIFTTTFPLGGRDLEKNIMKELKLEQKEAREVKINYGLHKKQFGGALFESLVPAISALADEIKKASRYYEEHVKHRHGASPAIGEILLLGGDANLLGLDTYLSSTLGVRAKTADIFLAEEEGAKKPIPAIPKNKSLAYATAIGLAMRTYS